MKISLDQLDSVIELCHKGKKNLLIEGPTGCGKTEKIKQFCEKNGLKLYSVRAADSEASDFKGLPVEENGKMNFLRPMNLPSFDEKNTVLFLDEINRARNDVMNCIMELTDSNKKTGIHQLPADCWIVAAMNPDSEEYQVNQLDAALDNRFPARMTVDYDRSALLSYAVSKNWHQNVIRFVTATKDIFHANALTDSRKVTSRGLESLSDFEHIGFADKRLHLAIADSCLGTSLAHQYIAFVYETQAITWAEMLTDSKNGLKKIKEMARPEAYRADLLSQTNDDICESMTKSEGLSKKDLSVLENYVSTIGADLAVGLVQKLITVNGKLLETLQSSEKIVSICGGIAKT
jgi:hypothetical protein